MKVVDWSDSSCHLLVTLFWCFYPFSKDITCCINHVCTVVSVVLSNLDCGRNKTNSYLLFSGWDLQQRKGRKLDGILRYNFLFISSFEMQVFSGYAHWGTLLWHECCCQVFNIFHLKRRKNIFIDKFIPRSFTRNCIYSGNNPIGIHNGIDGLIKVLLLDFPALLILVLYSCTHSSLTRRKVGPSYFYPIYNFSVYHLCIISPGGVCVQSCDKCKHYLLGWGETHRMVWRQWMGGWGSNIYNEYYVPI